MKPLSAYDNYRVGIAGGIGLLVMALLLLFISTASFGKERYSAYLEHTAGLRVGESVQVAGVDVGEVTGISLHGHEVRIEFTLDRKIRLGSATTADVKVLTLLGTHFLNVTPKGAGALRNDAIPLAQTTVPFNLQDVIESAGTSLEEFDSKKISASLTVMAEALRGTPDAAREALVGVSKLSRVAADRADQMRTLLASTRTVTGKLAANSDDIVEVMKQSNLVLAELVARRETIHQMLVDSQKLATAISGVIDDNDAQFAALMKDLTSTLKLLRDHEKGLGASIDGLASTSRYFANATGNGPWMDLHVPVAVPDNLSCLNPSGGCQ
ncbi:MAG: MCE family protein [Actinomycetota bacterium]|nr:MCE family protein [Actinomycetota bacterium]